MVFNATAGDYFGYIFKDAESFIQGIQKSQSQNLLLALSDSPTINIHAQQIVDCYPKYTSDFSLNLPARLIPFHVIDEANKTILTDVYIPYTLLLKRRPINTFFQHTSEAMAPKKATQGSAIISLHKTMQLDIARKIEVEQIMLHAVKDKAMQHQMVWMQQQEQKQKAKYEKDIADLKDFCTEQQKKFDEDEERYKKTSEEEFEKQKKDYENVHTSKLSQLQQQLRDVESSKSVLETLLQEADKKFLKKETEFRKITLQRNILLCFIPFLLAIGWYINNKAAVS